MPGILAMPSWELFSSQDSRAFFNPRALSERPLTNLTITDARSTGLPRSLVTWICSRVRSSARIGRDNSASRRTSFRMAPIISRAFSRDIRKQKPMRFPGRIRHGLRREIPAAHRAFHDGGPSRTGPVSGQKEVPNVRPAQRPPRFQARLGRENSADFLDHVSLFQFRSAGTGKKLLQLPD